MKSTRFLSCCLLIPLVVASGSSHAQNIISEDMESDNFSTSNLSSGAGATEPDFVYGAESVGGTGNPGAGYVVTWSFESLVPGPMESGSTEILYEHSTSYQPSTQGTITALDFSIQYKLPATEEAFSSIAFFLRDGGNGRQSSSAITLIKDDSWHTASLSALTADDFPPVNGQIDFASNQGFHFGFFLQGTHPNGYGSGNPSTSAISMDNFTVTIVPVPEPATATLVLIGGLVGLGLRRRRSLG
jgi:hypothetical protein